MLQARAAASSATIVEEDSEPYIDLNNNLLAAATEAFEKNLCKLKNNAIRKYNIVLILCFYIYKYGIKSISIKHSQVRVSLTYSPKGETFSQKFGNLPITT